MAIPRKSEIVTLDYVSRGLPQVEVAAPSPVTSYSVDYVSGGLPFLGNRATSLEKLYINGDGGVTSGWRAEGGDYQKIDEVGANDGDTTYLYTPTNDDIATFLVGNPSSLGDDDIILSVIVHGVVRSVDPTNNTMQVGVRISSTNYFSSNHDTVSDNTNFLDFATEFFVNPNTSSAWTYSDIQNLEVAIKKTNAVGMRLTQMYVEVKYQVSNVTYEQEGFRFRSDDGDEDAATWLEAQDTDISRAINTNTRLRILVNATGDPTGKTFQLEFREAPSGDWAAVPVNTAYSADKCTGGTSFSSAENDPSEGDDEAFDNNTATKWLAFAATGHIGYQFGSDAQHTIQKYTITSANDEPTRDPRDWTFQGSNDGSSWDDLDTQTDQTWSNRFEEKEYVFSNSTAYEYYRLNITENNGAGITQIAEIEMMEEENLAFIVSASSNITSSGENTTAQLTAPSGKTTSNFTAGRMQDDENPADSIDIEDSEYTELEWCIQATDAAVDETTYQFRITRSGTVLDTYTVYPEWTISSEAVSTTKSNGVKANIKVTTTQNNLVKANVIVRANTHNNVVKANIKATTTQNNLVKANIKSVQTKSNLVVANIKTIITWGNLVKANIKSILTQNNAVRGNIFNGNQTPQSVKANILVRDNTKNNAVKANIKTINTKGEFVRANIKVTQTKNNIVIANIRATATRNNLVKSNIRATTTQNNLTKSNIKVITQQSNNATANILVEDNQRANSVKSSIRRTESKNNLVKASIRSSTQSANLVLANVRSILTQSNAVKARIEISVSVSAGNAVKASFYHPIIYKPLKTRRLLR